MLKRATFPALLTESIRRTCLDEGDFGAIAPVNCWHCGKVWGEIEAVCIQRQTYWQPGEYEGRCPSCGRLGDCSENEDYAGFHVLGRRRLKL